MLILSTIELLDTYGISKSCAIRTFQRVQELDSLESRTRSGAPVKYSERTCRSIIRYSLQYPHLSASEISRNFSGSQSLSSPVSPTIVQYILAKNGLRSFTAIKKPFLNKRQKRKRFDFCKKYQNKDLNFWKRVIFSDESYFQVKLDSIINRVRRFSTQNALDSRLVRKTTKYPLKVMIWGCFNFNGLGRIKICEGNMNRSKYIETLEEKLIPSIQDLDIQNPIHLDDSAPPHRGKSVEDWHTKNNIEKIDWPGNSPDLNPIENLWAIVKRKLNRRMISNKRQLIEQIIAIWHKEIDDDIIKNLVNSMKNRINQVLMNKGNNSKY